MPTYYSLLICLDNNSNVFFFDMYTMFAIFYNFLIIIIIIIISLVLFLQAGKLSIAYILDRLKYKFNKNILQLFFCFFILNAKFENMCCLCVCVCVFNSIFHCVFCV